MKDQKWEGIISELKAGVTDPSHPFKFSTLATLGLGNLPRLRTVRIRDFDPQNMRLTFTQIPGLRKFCTSKRITR